MTSHINNNQERLPDTSTNTTTSNGSEPPPTHDAATLDLPQIPPTTQRRPGGGGGAPSYRREGPNPHPDDAGDFFSTAFYTRMREQAAAGGGGGRYPGARYARAPQGVRVNLFDIFRFSPGNRENLGVPKARWRNILIKLDVSLEELLSGVVKEVDVSRREGRERGGRRRTCLAGCFARPPPEREGRGQKWMTVD